MVEHALVEEHQGTHGLVLRSGSDVAMHCQVGQECLDLGFSGQEVRTGPHKEESSRTQEATSIEEKMIVPEYIAKELELDYSTRRNKLPDSQKDILKYIEVQSNRRASVPQKDFEAEFGSRVRSIYWRLESLCYLGFIEKEVTDFWGNTPRYNYRLSHEYEVWLSRLRGEQPHQELKERDI